MSEDNVTDMTPGMQRAESFYAEPATEAPVDETPSPETALPEKTDLVSAIDNETSPAPTEQDAGGQSEEVQNLNELLQTMEVDQNWFEDLEVERKINGEMQSFRVGDLFDAADKMAAADDYLADAKRKGKQAIEEAEQQKNLLGENLVALGNLVQHAKESLIKEAQGIDWADLRKKDPSEWSARREEIREREEALNNIVTQAALTYRDALDKNKKKEDERLAAELPQQRKILFNELKDWGNDMQKAETESAAVFKMLREKGFNDDEIKAVTHDGIKLSMAVKAMRYDQLNQRADSEEKRVRKIPRILKPGAEQTTAKSNANDQPKDRAAILYG